MNSNQLLAKGIQALKNGQREEARKTLLQVIEQDERNERAWLWLSGAVDTDEDRRVCLENVLTLNPHNATARKGLAKLGATAVAPNPVAPDAPLSDPYQPEPEKPAWAYTAPPAVTTAKKYNDVWSTTEDICAYCAQPVSQTDKRCPKCKRNLTTKVLRDPVPSKHYRILLTLFMVYNGFQYLGAIAIFLSTRSWATTIFVLIFAIPTTIFTAGIYFRQAWAYWLLVAAQLLQIGSAIFSSVILPAPPQLEIPPLFLLICLSPFLLIQLFIYYTIFMAGADFRKVKVRQIASVSDKIRDAAQYDRIAKKMAQKGLWASAVLNWQRAVGRTPGHAGYHLRLAKAYSKLSFHQRGLDSLAMAMEKTHSDDTRQSIQKEIIRIEGLLKNKA